MVTQLSDTPVLGEYFPYFCGEMMVLILTLVVPFKGI